MHIIGMYNYIIRFLSIFLHPNRKLSCMHRKRHIIDIDNTKLICSFEDFKLSTTLNIFKY